MFHAEIEATNLCNTRCLQCPHEVMSRPRGRMEWATFETVIRKIRAHTTGGRFSVSFSGMGEPLLNPLLPRFIQHVAHEARTSFACNGAVLTRQLACALRDAGLDHLYFSFNGDEARIFRAMMGGLSFERVVGNLRQAIVLARGSRLEIRANVCVTKTTRHRLTAIQHLLRSEGVAAITFSLCHSRGGNLRDPTVCDTPPSPADLVHCEVIRNTLFVDWRGRVFICDHDIHAEHGLGDLMNEPLETILSRRQELIDHGMPFKMCRECNDLLKGGFHLFPNGDGGTLTDWIRELYVEPAGRFSEATPAQRWMLQLYAQEDRLDRAVNRLLRTAKELQQRVAQEQANRESIRGVLNEEIENLRTGLKRTIEASDRHIAQLETELRAIQRTTVWRVLMWARKSVAQLKRAARGAPLSGDDSARPPWDVV